MPPTDSQGEWKTQPNLADSLNSGQAQDKYNTSTGQVDYRKRKHKVCDRSGW